MDIAGTGGTLLVDLGNTRIKWAWLQGGVTGDFGVADWEADGRESPVNASGQPHAIVPHESTMTWVASDPPPFAPGLAPTRILFSPMSRPQGNARLALWVRQLWDIVAEACPAEPARDGLVNGYREPARLGADRWWAMVAAWRETRGAVMVVDAGTALTLDGIDADGRHVVGYLQAGRELQARALGAGTGVSGRQTAGPAARRPVPAAASAAHTSGASTATAPEAADPATEAPASGAGSEAAPHDLHGTLDTAGCIEAALLLAQAGLVEAAWRDFLRNHPGARLFLTGGDQARLAAALGHLPVETRPHLLFAGLAARAEDA